MCLIKNENGIKMMFILFERYESIFPEVKWMDRKSSVSCRGLRNKILYLNVSL